MLQAMLAFVATISLFLPMHAAKAAITTGVRIQDHAAAVQPGRCRRVSRTAVRCSVLEEIATPPTATGVAVLEVWERTVTATLNRSHGGGRYIRVHDDS